MSPRLVRRNHGGGHSYLLDESKAIGVTTACKAIPAPGLIKWAGEVTAEYAVDHWDDLAALPPMARAARLKAARFETMNRAAMRGTRIHTLGERVSNGEEVDAGEHTAEVEAYARFLDRWAVEVIATETPLAHTEFRYAGTADAWVTFGRGPYAGARVLLDIKTGRGVFNETALQLTAYRYGDLWQPHGPESEEPLPPCDAVAVAHILPDAVELLPVEADERQFRQFRYCIETTRWVEGRYIGAPLDIEGAA